MVSSDTQVHPSKETGGPGVKQNYYGSTYVTQQKVKLVFTFLLYNQNWFEIL